MKLMPPRIVRRYVLSVSGKTSASPIAGSYQKVPSILKSPLRMFVRGGLTLLAMPIHLNGNTVIGAHCVTISNPNRSKFSIYDIAAHFHVDAHILWDAVKKTPLMPKPILKIAREQVFSTTELISKIFTRIYALQQSEAAMAEKYRSIEEFFRNQKND